MTKIRLGVNIDHVATIRNARGENYPDPVKAALLAQNSGADSITIHLREDRRHIRDYDLIKIIKSLKIPLNLEMAPTEEMLGIAIKHKPDYTCIVPEKRKEITTEGGLSLERNTNHLKKTITKLKKNKIRVSLFIEPKIFDINLSKLLGADCVELHTGRYCNLLNRRKKLKRAFYDIKKSAHHAKLIGLDVHVGHGLTFKSAANISKIQNISEFNIGHFLIAQSLFIGLKKTVAKFKKIINS